MNRKPWVLGILSILFGVFLLLFVHGPRAWYTGIFFFVIGIVMLVRARRRRGE